MGSTTPRFPTSQRLSMVCRSVDTATPPPSPNPPLFWGYGGWDGGRRTVQYTTVLACAEDLHSSDAHGLYSTKKNYLKVLVQIFFDCSLVDLFINLCVIICDKYEKRMKIYIKNAKKKKKKKK